MKLYGIYGVFAKAAGVTLLTSLYQLSMTAVQFAVVKGAVDILTYRFCPTLKRPNFFLVAFNIIINQTGNRYFFRVTY